MEPGINVVLVWRWLLWCWCLWIMLSIKSYDVVVKGGWNGGEERKGIHTQCKRRREKTKETQWQHPFYTFPSYRRLCSSILRNTNWGDKKGWGRCGRCICCVPIKQREKGHSLVCVCVCLHFGGWSRFSGLLHGREPSSFILTHCLLLFPRLFIQCQRHHGPIADIGHENMETLHLMSQSMASVGV